ncbi:MAG: hypothetical protein WBD17_03295 [Candidatus Omnitrophota bacterium]
MWIVGAALALACAAASAIYLALPRQADYGHLTGRWVRPDGGYILLIREISVNGKIDASYLDPRPVNVSKAEASTKAGKVTVFVELRDHGYPGSFYTLTYDPDTDRLTGVYHHLGIGQDFNVVFVRK